MKPTRLKAGDEIRVIAPSRSLAIVKGEQRRLAEERLSELGFRVTYGDTTLVHDDFLLQFYRRSYRGFTCCF